MRISTALPLEVESLIQRTIGACLEVHRALGPGMSELVYNRAVRRELTLCAIPFEPEKRVRVQYKGVIVGHQRIDFLIDKVLVLELKSVDRIHPIHLAQAVRYLHVAEVQAGLVINFNVTLLKFGIRRVVT